MNSFIFLENTFTRALSIILVFTLLFSGLQFSNQNSVVEDIDESISHHFFNQVINSAIDCFSTKTNIRLLPEPFSEHFYSFECSKNKLSQQTKMLTIVSETYSEMRIRNSTFLISQSTTST